MKRMSMFLLSLLLCLCCTVGMADTSSACTKVMADLLDAPHAKANVLMRYYIGTRVEVVREVDSDYVQVNVGAKGGSLMGYMEKRDLAFGEKEIRAVRAEAVSYTAEVGARCRLYSYPDKLAPVSNAEFDISVKSVLGYRQGDWLHVDDGLGHTGFVARDEIALTDQFYHNAAFIYVEPAEDEMTRAEAIIFARGALLSAEDDSTYTEMEGLEITAERLDACIVECDLLYYYEMPEVTMYSILFRDPDTGHVYAGIDFLTQGREVIKISHGNG